MPAITMTIQATNGDRVVMFGRADGGKWFERYYPTAEAAEKFAAKRGWTATARTPAQVGEANRTAAD